MGVYDTIVLGDSEDDEFDIQTKAFGRGMRSLCIGDEVTLVAAWVEEPTYREDTDHEAARLAVQVSDYKVEASLDCVFIEVRGGRIFDVTMDPDKDLPTFDYYGWPKSS